MQVLFSTKSASTEFIHLWWIKMLCGKRSGGRIDSIEKTCSFRACFLYNRVEQIIILKPTVDFFPITERLTFLLHNDRISLQERYRLNDFERIFL